VKLTRRQLRKLITESALFNNVDFDIVHEGLFTGGTFERYYVIVTYSPQMIAANLGLSGDFPGEESIIFYSSTGTAGGSESGEFLPVGGMNQGLRSDYWSDIDNDRWVIKMRGRKSVDPGTIAASIKSQLERMYSKSKVDARIEELVAKDYAITKPDRPPGHKFYSPNISNVGQYNANQMSYQHHYRSLRSDLEQMYPPSYHGDLVITSPQGFLDSYNALSKRMTDAVEHFSE
jgi:hypothetical protein